MCEAGRPFHASALNLMAISLVKRSRINLKKSDLAPLREASPKEAVPAAEVPPQCVQLPALIAVEPSEPLHTALAEAAPRGLSSITVGAGWKIQSEPESSPGFWKWLVGWEPPPSVDLDVIAFVLDEKGQVAELGDSLMIGSDIVFFNNPRHRTGAVMLSGDNRMGGAGVQDEEQIFAHLDKLDTRYHRVKFALSIYDGQNRRQHFGNLEGVYVRALDSSGKEVARCNLDNNPAYVGRCTLVFGEAFRADGIWQFRLLNEAYSSDSFETVLFHHVPQ